MNLIIATFGAAPDPSVWTWSPGTLESIATAMGALATGGAALWAARVAADRFSLEEVRKDRVEAEAAREADAARSQEILRVEREERQKDRMAAARAWMRRPYVDPAHMSDDEHAEYVEQQEGEAMTEEDGASLADQEAEAQRDEGR